MLCALVLCFPDLRTVCFGYHVGLRQLLTFGCPAKRYTADHEVVNFDDATGIGIVSITNHAQSVLGDVVFVELPTVGSKFTQGG